MVKALTSSTAIWGLLLGCALGSSAALWPAATARYRPSELIIGASLFGAFGGYCLQVWLHYRRANFPLIEPIRAPRPRYSLRRVVLATTLCSILLASWVNWPFVSKTRIDDVKPGMTEAEVLRIMGEPASRSRTHWVWSRWPPPGVAVVEFAADGRVYEAFNN